MQKVILSLTLVTLLGLSSCKKDTGPEPATPSSPSYTVSTTYTYSNANFTSSTQRINMLGEMTTYIKTAHTTTASPALSGTKLTDMYANLNSQFTDATLNTSGIQIKDQVSNTYNLQAELSTVLTDIGNVTQTTPTASNGVAGKLVSGTKAYLVDANGVEYKEVFEKGVMGGLLYSQAITRFKNIAAYDNLTIVTGQGTAQEHAWDEAFGYFGVQVDFPTNTTGLKNWGSYCNSVNVAIGSSATIMNAFLKGRAAISNKDDAGRNAARDIVVATWEKVAAARFITYVKGAKTNITDDALRSHYLSEALGLIKAFKYNPDKKISDAQVGQIVTYLGTNFYTVTISDLDNAINLMASIFTLDPNTL